jgi:radical SAM PhpK family P-methyltransferase
MRKTIDCLLIGHNEVDFGKYVGDVRDMGAHSGAFRDLNLAFLQSDQQPYHAAGMFNRICNRAPAGNGLKPVRDGESFSNTIAYLGTYLEGRGLTFDYIHSFQAEKQALAEKLERENILTIAITTTLYVFALPIIEIVNFIKQHNRTAKIIIGGPFVSTQFRIADAETLEYLFESLGADIYVISSQGENTLVKIIQALKSGLPPHEINNIYYKTSGGYASTPLLKEDNKLSENMVKWDLFSERVENSVNLRASISCPFSCAFCGFPEHAGKYQTADIEAIEGELNRLKEIESVKSIHIIDDTLNVPAKRFKNLLRMLVKNKYKFKWYSQFRCQFADEETVALMKESGCEGVFLGLESGNDHILNNMNKAASVEAYLKGIELLKKYEILAYGSFIIGFPGETRETVQDTVRLIEESKVDFFRTQLWYCEPVTPIWQQRETYKIEGSQFEWRHATMDSKEAADLIEDTFLSVKKSTWLPQYGFDFNHLFHLINRIPLERVKDFITAFNEGIKEKLLNPTRQEVGTEVMDRLVRALIPEEEQAAGVEEFTIDFELD